MGTLLGHVAPGFCFLSLSLWWMWSILHRHFVCLRQLEVSGGRQKSYRNTTSFPVPCCPKRPVESFVKLFFIFAGTVGEFSQGLKNGDYMHINTQHMTMYMFFAFNAVIEICLQNNYVILPDLEYVSGILAFAMEGFLFFNHLDGRSKMDVQVHMFLFYAVVCCVLSTMYEMKYRRSLTPALCRAFFTCLQGTWFLHLGWILYPMFGPPWDEDSHTEMMLVTIIFACHVGVIFVFLIVLSVLVRRRVRNLPIDTPYLPLESLSNAFHKVDPKSSPEDIPGFTSCCYEEDND